MVSDFVNRRGRVHGDGEADGLTDALVGDRGHGDGGHDRSDTLVDSCEGGDVASAFSGETDGRVGVDPVEGGSLDSACEGDSFSLSTVANDLVGDFVNRRSRVHGDGEADGFTDAIDVVVAVGRLNTDGSHDRSDTFVDGGEGGDVASAFGVKADGSIGVGPMIGHFTVGGVVCESDLSDLVTVAGHYVSHSLHDGDRVDGDLEFLS